MCFTQNKNGQRKYKYLATGRDKSYFVINNLDSTRKFSETDVTKMLEFLIYNIFVKFYSRIFNRQSEFLWVPAVFFSLTCFFFHTGLLMKYETNLSRSYNFKFSYIHDVF